MATRVSMQRHWLIPVARVGFLTKGVVYLLIGGLAALAAFGEGGKVGGSEEAVQTIGSQPFGTFLLYATGIGLFAYAIWRFVQAAFQTGEGWAHRIGWAVSGVLHIALGVAAFQMASGSGSGGSRNSYLAKMLTWPGGQLLVAVIGLGIIAAGVHQLHKAYTGRFEKDLKLDTMSREERVWALRMGRLGHAARGVVFPIIGFFVLKAAWSESARQAKGLGGALREIGTKPHGEFLLAVVAIGLALYGAFQLMKARYPVVRV